MDKIEEIKKVSMQFNHAINHRDIRLILYLYGKDPKFIPYYSDIPQFGTIKDDRWTHGYLQDYWQQMFNITGGGFKYVQSGKDIHVIGEIVYEIGVYDLRMSNKEDEIEEGTYFILWERDFDAWKIAVHIYNSMNRPKWGKPNSNV